MWIHVNGNILKRAKSIIDDNGIQHPAQIFKLWSRSELFNRLGYKPFRKTEIDERFYVVTATTDVEENGVITRTYSLEPKYTLTQIKKYMNDQVKETLKEIYLNIVRSLDFLNEFEPGSGDITDLENLKTQLKNIYSQIKSDAMDITDYDEMVSFYDSWKETYLPNIS